MISVKDIQKRSKTPTTGQDDTQQVYHNYIYNNYYCDYIVISLC